MNRKFCFWWSIPCKGIIDVFKYFCENISPDSILITPNLSDERRKMGWEDVPVSFKNHIIITDSDLVRPEHLLMKYSDYFHLIGGTVYPPFINKLALAAIKNNIPYGIMTESICNMSSGFQYVLKQIYLKYIFPVRSKQIASNAKIAFCLSGSKSQDLVNMQHMGFKKELIVPYGYWTDECMESHNLTNSEIQIICPGLLERYKGVDLLLKAIKLLKGDGFTSFKCHITGFGSQEQKLKKMIKILDISDIVSFHGVLSESDMNTLLKNIDILVAPGYREPWGIRVNEAIQRGNAVICSDGIGASTLIEEGKGGSVFRSGDYIDLYSKLKEYFVSNNKLSKVKSNNLVYKERISCKVKAVELYNLLNCML